MSSESEGSDEDESSEITKQSETRPLHHASRRWCYDR